MRKSNFSRKAVSEQLEKMKELVYENNRLAPEVKASHESLLMAVSELQTAVPVDVSNDFADYLNRVKTLSSEIDQQRLKYKRAASKICKNEELLGAYLKEFFGFESGDLESEVVIDGYVLHLYTLKKNLSVAKDQNHGHYGVDFGAKIVFWREWGNRVPKKKLSERLSFKNYEACKSFVGFKAR